LSVEIIHFFTNSGLKFKYPIQSADSSGILVFCGMA